MEAARAIVEAGVAVMGHVGLTPQSISVLGGFRPQAQVREQSTALHLGLDLPPVLHIGGEGFEKCSCALGCLVGDWQLMSSGTQRYVPAFSYFFRSRGYGQSVAAGVAAANCMPHCSKTHSQTCVLNCSFVMPSPRTTTY